MKLQVSGKISSRLRAKSVSNSTIIGVQVGLNEHEVRAVLEQLLQESLVGHTQLSASHADRHIPNTPEIGSGFIVAAAALRHVRELEDEYERAIELIGAGETAYGELLLLELLAVLSKSDLSDRCRNLRVRVALRLGAIRRDRGNIGGLNGAFHLFRSAYDEAAHLGECAMQTALAINLAACLEMSERYSEAFKTYGLAHDLAASTGDALYELWGSLRQQTVLTKTGEADSAAKALERLMPAAAEVDTLRLHRVCLLKQAAAYKQLGDFDRALDRAFDATNLVATSNGLIAVQHDVLLADLYLSARMEGDGVRHLARAEELAIENGYAHQLKAIDNVLGSYLGVPEHERLRPEVRQLFRPTEVSIDKIA